LIPVSNPIGANRGAGFVVYSYEHAFSLGVLFFNSASRGTPNAQEIRMSKTINIAKFTLGFVIIAGGFSIIIGSLMGADLRVVMTR